MCFMRGVSRRHLFLLLSARRTQSDKVLCALQLLMLGVEFSKVGEILRFRFREFAAEDDCQGLTSPYMIAKHDRDLPDDAVRDWRHMHLTIFVGFYDPWDAKGRLGRAVHHVGGMNLCLLEIVRRKID